MSTSDSTADPDRRIARGLLIAVGVLLFAAHHDFWNWTNRSVIFGFLPAGMAYHMAYSVATGAFWLMVVLFGGWSHDVPDTTDAPAPGPPGDNAGTHSDEAPAA